MPLNYTAAPSSRITKASRRNPLQHRPTASPFSSHPRRKASTTPRSKTHRHDEYADEQLPDALIPVPLPLAPSATTRPCAVLEALSYIHTHKFTPLPPRAAGMSSTRISEVLRFRAGLPPIVTVAHVQALLGEPTRVEREIAELVGKGEVRRVVVPWRRGEGGEGVVRWGEWVEVVRGTEGVDGEVKEKLLTHLHANPTSTTLPTHHFSPAQATSLIHAGLLTHAHLSTTPDPTILSLPSLSLARTAPSGTPAASGTTHSSTITLRRPTEEEESFRLALPNTGPYLKLLTDARAHFLDLLRKSSPRYREAPLSALREKWDGGVFAEPRQRRRGELGVLPGRTRKWKEFYGVAVEWVVGECVGAGLVEVFETGTVGVGVRGTGRRS